jgi:hypothetical protein
MRTIIRALVLPEGADRHLRHPLDRLGHTLSGGVVTEYSEGGIGVRAGGD